jgi:hypothetical protein
VPAFVLDGTRRPGGGRDRQLEVREGTEQPRNDSALADP